VGKSGATNFKVGGGSMHWKGESQCSKNTKIRKRWGWVGEGEGAYL